MSEQAVHYPYPEPESELRAAQGDYMPTNGNGHKLNFRCSQELGKLAEALAKAQLTFKPIKKQVENTFYFNEKTKKRAMYADLATIIDATQVALAENQLVVIQIPVTRAREAGVISRLQHSSNQFMECELYLPATGKSSEWNNGVKTSIEKFDAQTIGAAITYARRYTYGPTVGVSAEEDDDANSISEPSGGSKEAAQAVADKKIKDSGVVPSLFFIWNDESQTAEITGSESLKTANRELLKPLWNPTVGALVANGDQLDALKYELEKRGVPFSRLGAPPLVDQLKASVEKVAKSKKV